MDLRTEVGRPVAPVRPIEILDMPRRRAPTRRWPVLALGVVVTATFVIHLLAALRMRAPIIHPDEAGYLGNARFIVDGFGRTFEGYASGYSLLLVPAALVGRDPMTAYRLSLVTNALLAATVPLLAYVLVRRVVPDAPDGAHLAAAGFLAALPAYAVTANLVMSENALVPTVLACACLISVAGSSTRRWSAAGALAVYAFWITPRGSLVVAAFVFACLASTRPWKNARPGAPALVIVAVGVVAGWIVNTAVAGTTRVPGAIGADNGLGHIAATLVHPRLWNDAAANLLGWFASSVVASFGIVLIGLVALATKLRGPFRPTGLFLLAAFFATYVLGSVSVVQAPLERTDLLIYARYLDGVAAPVLAIGAASVFAAARQHVLRRTGVVLAGAGALLATVLLFGAVRPPNTTDAFFNSADALGLELYHTVFDTTDPARLLLIGAAVATLIALTIARTRRVGALVALATLVVSSSVAYRSFAVSATDARAHQHELVVGLQRLHDAGVDVSCITIDNDPPPDWWAVQNYRFFYPDARYEWAQAGTSDCGPVVISATTDLNARVTGARLVMMENDIPVGLWLVTTRVPPVVRTTLAAEGLMARTSGS